MKFIEFIKSMQKWIIKLNRKEVQKKIGKFQFFLFIGLLILTFIDGENGSSTNDIIRIFVTY